MGGDSKETASRGAAPLLDISGVIVDKPESSQRFKQIKPPAAWCQFRLLQETLLFDIVNTIRQAKDDPQYHRYRDGFQKLLRRRPAVDAEHRQSPERVCDSGKPVYAVGENYSQGKSSRQFRQKIGCHRKAWLIGRVLLPTVAYKSLLDKLKVSTHAFRVVTYKSAVEPFIVMICHRSARS